MLKSKNRALEEEIKAIKQNNTTNVKFCDVAENPEIVFDNSIDVHFSKSSNEGKVVIVDCGAPLELSGRSWFLDYVNQHGIDKETLQRKACSQYFRFGPSKKYHSSEMYMLPLNIREMTEGNQSVRLYVMTYIVDADIPLLIGKRTLMQWKANMNFCTNVLTTNLKKEQQFQMKEMPGGHLVLELE